jgi:hypothetical protein
MLGQPLILITVTLIIYVLSINAWADAEARYHTFVRFGAETAFSVTKKPDRTESPINGASPHDKKDSSGEDSGSNKE